MDTKPKKPFLTYDEQLEKLEKEKGLTIIDRQTEIKLLKEHSYYSLVSGYKKLFKGCDGRYREGVTLEDIHALYLFDDNIRNLIFRSILIVERRVKSLIAYAFCEKHGELQDHYLSSKNYNPLKKNAAAVEKLIQTLEKIHRENKSYPYVKYQLKTYGNVPLWVIMKALTLGNVSKMYSILTYDLQSKISHEFPGIRENDLGAILDFLSRIRNVCAHNERLYNYVYKKNRVRQSTLYLQFNPNDKRVPGDFFTILICLKYLIPEEPFSSLIHLLQQEIATLQKNTKHISNKQICAEMGLPEEWVSLRSEVVP